MEDKVKIKLNKQRKVTKKIGEQSFTVKPFISLVEKQYILNELTKSIKSRIQEEESIESLILGLQGDLDIIVCVLCTNIDLEGLEYEDIYNSDLLNIVKSTVKNYKDIENSVNNLLEVLKLESLVPDMSKMTEQFNISDLLKNKSASEIKALTEELKEINLVKEG